MNCLLISPLAFYDFHDQLGRALVKKGYDVSFVNDEVPNSLLIKIISKFRLHLLARIFSLKYFERSLIETKCEHFDLIIIVRGRGVSRKAIRLFRAFSSNIVGYNFDSFMFNPGALDWMSDCTRYCTFDPQDARQYSLPLVQLFADDSAGSLEVKKQYDVSCIMKIHSSRLNYVWEFLSRFPQLTCYVYLYVPNIFSLILLILTRPRLFFRLREYMHYSPMSPLKYNEVLRSSNCALDYAHDSQTGITKRCFEALAAGVGVITNNPEVTMIDESVSEHFLVMSLADLKAKTSKDIPSFCARPVDPFIRNANDFLNDLTNGVI